MNPGLVINSSDHELSPNISADGSTLYFASMPPGGTGNADLWQAPIIPVVDFNGDEIVDLQDLLRLIESWGKDDPSVDIGPMPWGDGKVDEKDLEVLMRYWQQEVLPVSLIAYWKLDEVEGTIAADRAGTNNATLVGDPIWQPTGGKLGGALQLDGVDDCVTTEFLRDPSEGAFSVLVWVKGDVPGQVILSQEKGANWLVADGAAGALRTDLCQPGTKGRVPTPPGPPLISSRVITDGDWHCVGLMWDGSNRILCVDGAEVARDTQASLVGTYLGLHIGAGKGLEPGSFWSGLIDDVRIYDRAVKP